MQDLINEEEFIAKKNDYNPWRCFGVFYGITFITIILIIAIIAYMRPERPEMEVFVIYIVAGPPAILSFTMIFHTKKNYSLPYKSIVLAIIGLMMVYLIGVFIGALYTNRTSVFSMDGLYAFLTGVVIYVSLSLMCFIVIYPILRHKRKRLKQRP